MNFCRECVETEHKKMCECVRVNNVLIMLKQYTIKYTKLAVFSFHPHDKSIFESIFKKKDVYFFIL